MAGYARRGIFMHGWGLDLTRASSAFENDCRYVLRACRVYISNARALPHCVVTVNTLTASMTHVTSLPWRSLYLSISLSLCLCVCHAVARAYI